MGKSVFSLSMEQPLCQNVYFVILSNRLRFFFVGYSVSQYLILDRHLFFSHSDQRKEAKERRFIDNVFLTGYLLR